MCNVVVGAGMVAHVMTFEVGAVLEDQHWQAPVYCFDNKTSARLLDSQEDAVRGGTSHGMLMREIPHSVYTAE